MNRRNFFFLLGNSAAWLLSGCGKADKSARLPASPSASVTQPDNSTVLAYQQQNQAEFDAATQRANQQQNLADAGDRTAVFRTGLQKKVQGQWSTLIHKNLQTFDDLRKEAAQSSSRAVQCTICSGSGMFNFCLVCNDLGKCPTCAGKRTISYGVICPTCQGNGKCFFCHGSGKMACPFCDDGSVSANQPPPPYGIPIG